MAADLVEQALGVGKENSPTTGCTKTKEGDRILQPLVRSLPLPEVVRVA
jgi:hypothetical protein